MTTGRPARFPWKAYAIALVVIVLVSTAPLISVIISTFIADANGCVLNEADSHPCVIGGIDWGGALVVMFVMGWFMLATLPLGGGALIVWLVLLLIHFLAWRRKAATP